jgi:large subunit ribosomal protein L13
MDTLSLRTKSANKETVTKNWILIDAENEILGRLASRAAKILRGKNKPYYTPHVDCGDNVIIINAEKIRLTGNKLENKIYVRHTTYPGGQRLTSAREMLAKKPISPVEKAIKGMLPRTRLGREIYRNLHVYAGPEHPHEAQKPTEIKLNTIK